MQRILTGEEHARLAREIRDAESNTSGEIYVVVAHSADAFRLVPVLWGAVVALLLPWVLHLTTMLSTTLILVLQPVAFVVVSALLSLPQLRTRVVPSGLASEAAHRAAMAQFMAHGVHLTDERTGVLIYVCMHPRRIEVVADAGVHQRVGQQQWEAMVAQIATDARVGRLSEGLALAIQKTGAVLAEHFPRMANDRNALPDRVVET